MRQKKWIIHIKFDVFKFKEIKERLKSFSENHYIFVIFVAAIWEEERECVHFFYICRHNILFRLNIFDLENFQGSFFIRRLSESLLSLNILLAQKTFWTLNLYPKLK